MQTSITRVQTDRRWLKPLPQPRPPFLCPPQAWARALGGSGRHIGGPAHLVGSLQGPLAVLQNGAEGDVGVLLDQLLNRHFVHLGAKKSHVIHRDHQHHMARAVQQELWALPFLSA